MWRYAYWNKAIKIIITAIFVLFSLTSFSSSNTKKNTTNDHTQPATKTTETGMIKNQNITATPEVTESPTVIACIEADTLERLAEKEIERMQFSQEFINKVVEKAKQVVYDNRKSIDSQRQAILNQKTELENKRNKLEVKILDDTIDRETYQRLHADFNDKITNLNNLIQEIENNANVDIDLIEEVLAFTRNIHATYLQAPQFLKRHYLRFFFEKLVVKDRMIVKIVYTPIFSVLQENHAVIISDLQLRD